ncbi:serine hydrolase [Paenibacillus sp. LMG 31460]|uniref:Serine hydrolase n=1 Tax=Paenibacillus germinis TaxID=2654979 RepID=A0ABX1Z885_9BACL|nr:serine hydrolase [Paenibacillus germinis]NOU89367.1 serine hydrolase [Paenibacillus germinis]
MNLQQKLENAVKDERGTFGVAVKHLATKEEANINEERLFQMASSFKVPILTTLYRDVEAGKIRLDERVKLKWEERVPGSGVLQLLDPEAEVSIRDMAMLMIIVSDNYATDRVLDLVGGPKQVEAYMKELGLNHILVNQSCWDLLTQFIGMEPQAVSPEAYDEFVEIVETSGYEKKINDVDLTSPDHNVATPRDMGKLLEMIAQKELFSESSSNGVLDIMCKQQFRNRIPYLLPEQVKVASKTGTIGSAVNDVGIVYLPEEKGVFTITVFSEGDLFRLEGEQAIARLAKAAYDHFMGN